MCRHSLASIAFTCALFAMTGAFPFGPSGGSTSTSQGTMPGTFSRGGSQSGTFQQSSGTGTFPQSGAVSQSSAGNVLPQGGTFPSGTFPRGNFPNGIFPQNGTFPSGTIPSGTFPSGTFPSGTFPSGTFRSGTFSSRSFPQGNFPSQSGVNPQSGSGGSGTFPQSVAFPSGTFPSGIFPSGAFPQTGSGAFSGSGSLPQGGQFPSRGTAQQQQGAHAAIKKRDVGVNLLADRGSSQQFGSAHPNGRIDVPRMSSSAAGGEQRHAKFGGAEAIGRGNFGIGAH